jgi:D-threo-aldose 1-dehydrogenase
MKIDTRTRLGKSDVYVTALGLGGAAIGNLYAPVSETTAKATVDRALALGIRYFDTAPYYGYGLSEQRLGAALSETERDTFAISTKVGRLLEPRAGEARSDQGFIDANAFDPVFDYSYEGIMRSFESSLARLGTDRIDVLLMHDIGALTHGGDRHHELFEIAMKEGLRAMRALRDSGAVGAIGLGVNECEVCVEAIERVDLDCILLAGRYTLLEQGALDRLLPLCEERETSLIVGGPYNSGVLVETETGDTRGHYDYVTAGSEILERVERLRRVCGEHDVPLAAAALQFPLHHPAVACVIPGTRSPEEVEANAHWLEFPVPAALYRDLVQADLLDPRAPIGGTE